MSKKKYTGFRKFEDAADFVFDEILKRVRVDLSGSMMKLSPGDSKKSNSRYITLSYKNRFAHLDPQFGERFPYMIRLSNHPINLFSIREADIEVQIKKDIDPHKMEQLKLMKKKFHSVVMQMYLTHDEEEKKKLIIKRNELRAKIHELINNSTFAFMIDLKAVISDLKKILQKNREIESEKAA